MAIPQSLDGVLGRPSDPVFPAGKSSDLESAARLPGTDRLLLVESTDNGGWFHHRGGSAILGLYLSVALQNSIDGMTFDEVIQGVASEIRNFGRLRDCGSRHARERRR